MSPSICLPLLLISLVTFDLKKKKLFLFIYFFIPRLFANLTTKGTYDLDYKINVERNSPEMLHTLNHTFY